ncbi:MAG TPA: hypothetical protein PKX16_03810, partial [Kiritimatiellia bacterium]|nr:hypothetical protein [Kiritimatiellia bacterium]
MTGAETGSERIPQRDSLATVLSLLSHPLLQEEITVAGAPARPESLPERTGRDRLALSGNTKLGALAGMTLPEFGVPAGPAGTFTSVSRNEAKSGR